MGDCIGTYTFESKNGKSAIDHILTNDKLYESYRGMHIDEDRAILNISDHNLVRAWFRIGPSSKPKWTMKKLKTSVNHHLRKRKKLKVGKKGNKIIRAAEWVDLELIESIKLRMRLNKNLRYSRRNQQPPVQKEFKEKYENKKKITAGLIC